MANINDLISTIPSMARQPRQQAQYDPQSTVNGALAYVLNFIKNDLPLKRDFEKSQELQLKLTSLITNLEALIKAQDTPRFTSEVTAALGELVERLNSPIVNVTMPDESIKAVERAVKAIELSSPDKVEVKNLKALEKGIGELKPLLKAIRDAVEDKEAAEEVFVKNLGDITTKVDLSEAIEYLKLLKNLETSAKNPLAVRLSDGKKYYEALATIERGVNAVALNSGNETPATKVVSGIKAMTGSAVQLTATSTNCRWIEIQALGQPIAVGGSDVALNTSTWGSSKGLVLFPANTPHKMRVGDPSLLYAVGASGAALGYNYYV